MFESKILMELVFQATLFCDMLYEPIRERSREPKHLSALMNKQVGPVYDVTKMS